METEQKKVTSKEYVETHLPKPITQKMEVLYELLKYYKEGRTRRDFINGIWCLNAPTRIMDLRRMGVEIETYYTKLKNKHGRPVKVGTYRLLDFANGVEIYTDYYNKKTQKNETKRNSNKDK